MPLYVAGQRIRGSEINALPQVYRVTSPQICNNSATLRDVVGLAFSADASAAYLVECFLAVHATEANNIKFAWAPTSGLFTQGDSPIYTGSWWSAQGVVSGSASGVPGALDSTVSATLTAAQARSGDNAVPSLLCPVAHLVIGTTAGVAKLQFAQNTNAVHDTTIRVGSCMRVSRLGAA